MQHIINISYVFGRSDVDLNQLLRFKSIIFLWNIHSLWIVRCISGPIQFFATLSLNNCLEGSHTQDAWCWNISALMQRSTINSYPCDFQTLWIQSMRITQIYYEWWTRLLRRVLRLQIWERRCYLMTFTFSALVKSTIKHYVVIQENDLYYISFRN